MSIGTEAPRAGTVVYDPELCRLIGEAMVRLRADLAGRTPFLAERIGEWMRKLAGGGDPAEYYKHPRAFPMLLLPWLLARALRDEPDTPFESDLVYSSINAYYFIRLLDNVMDGEADVELALLPVAGFFHQRFQGAYQPYFEPGHPFWRHFDAAWSAYVEVTAWDALLESVAEQDFVAICGRKSVAAGIPIAAVCCRLGREDRLAPWLEFLDRLGCWHQMINDLFGWQKDLRLGHRTFLLSEADRRRMPDETTVDWVIREGFDWGVDRLFAWMREMKSLAGGLACPPVLPYLEEREAWLSRQAPEAREGLRGLALLAKAFRGN